MLVFGDVYSWFPSLQPTSKWKDLEGAPFPPQKKRTSSFLALDSRFYPGNPKHKCSTFFWMGYQFSIKRDFGMEARLSSNQSPNMDYSIYYIFIIGLPGPERPFQPRISR